MMRQDMTDGRKHPITDRMKAALTKTLRAAAAKTRSARDKARAATGRRGRRRPGEKASIPQGIAQVAAAPATAPDPVDLVVQAMQVLTPASFRASTIGVPVTITVKDPRVAEIFRAALARTQQQRTTDRLVSVEVAH